MLLSRLIVLAANAGVVLLLTRYLSLDDFGCYATVQSYTLILATLAAGGPSIALIRELACFPGKASVTLSSGVLVQVAFLVVALGGGTVIAPLLYRDVRIAQGVRVVALSYAILIVANLFSSIFIARQRASYMSASVLVERLVFLALLFFILYHRLGLISILWAQVLSAAVQLAWALWITARHFVAPAAGVDIRISARLTWTAAALSFSDGLRALDQQLGVVVLEPLVSAATAALFAAPQRLIVRLTVLPDSILRGLLPVLSQLHVREDLRLVRIGGLMIHYVSLGGCVIAAAVAPAGRQFAVALFGPNYVAAGLVFSLLVWAVVPMFLNYVLKYMLAALNKQVYELIGLVLGLLTNIICVTLAPFGQRVFSAAFGLLVSQLVACAIGLVVLAKNCRLHLDLRRWARAVPVLLGMTSASWLVARFAWWFVGIFLIVFAGIALLVVNKVLDVAELRRFLSLEQAVTVQ